MTPEARRDVGVILFLATIICIAGYIAVKAGPEAPVRVPDVSNAVQNGRPLVIRDVAFNPLLPGSERRWVYRELGPVEVYVTKTGKAYHRLGCQCLVKSQIPIDLAEATARGYEACSICRPPLIVPAPKGVKILPAQQ